MNFHTHYQFNFEDGQSLSFELSLDRDTLQVIGKDAPPPADWAQLGFHQCANCPLSAGETPHCPVALALTDLVGQSERLMSYDKIEMIVTTEEREVRQNTTAQRGISSLMGLLMATSGCPKTLFFRPLARFHLPLATEEETVYRAAGTFFLTQFFLDQQGLKGSEGFAELNAIYKEMEEVNRGMANRLRAITKSDSSVNAISILDIFAKTVPWVLDDSLEDIRYMFSPYVESKTTA